MVNNPANNGLLRPIVGCPHCLQAKSTLQDLGPCHLLTYIYLLSLIVVQINLEYWLNQAVTPVEDLTAGFLGKYARRPL